MKQISLVFVLCVLPLANLLADEPKAKVLSPYTKKTNIAHRGASTQAPEHTIEAYKLAIAHGADFVEPDLQMTKDGVLVCIHDTSLERTTNVAEVYPDRAEEARGRKTWPVSSFTLAEIKKLDAGNWKDKKFAGATVPTFEEMIEVVRGQAGIIPETKAPEFYRKLNLNMEKEVMAVLSKAKLAEPGADPKTPVVIQSFSPESLKLLRTEHKCKLPLVYTCSTLPGTGSTKEKLEKVKEFADGIGPNKMLLTAVPDLVQESHSLGLSVTVWTFRSGSTGKYANVTEEMEHFLTTLGVDAVFTDDPDLFPKKK